METKFADGVSVYAPRQGAPEFIIADLNIDIARLRDWANKNQNLLVEGKNGKVLRMQVKRSKDGKLYASVDDFKPTKPSTDAIRNHPTTKAAVESFDLEDSSLPF